MSALGESSAAELAKRYQEKAQARKRGAGSHQPKFRGFSLKTLSDKAVVAVDGGRTVITNTTESGKTTTTRQRKPTEAQATSNDVQQDSSPPIEDSALKDTGLNERYQERFKARVRGTGADQKDKRRLSRQDKVPVETVAATRSNKDNRQQDKQEAVAARPMNSKPGVSPGFKIAWGKKTTVITSETSRPSEDRPQRTTATQSNGALEATYDDALPNYDDFDQGRMPSPAHDEVEIQGASVDEAESIQRREPSRNKRKPAPSTLAPETAISGKRGGIFSKKRRIINDETDENEDPLSVPETQGVDDSKTLANKSARGAKGKDAAASTKAPRAVPASHVAPTKLSKTTKAALSKETSGPLRQTTLMQLSSKSGPKPSSQGQDSTLEGDQSDSDFTNSMARSSRHALSAKSDRKTTKKAAAASQKGPSDKTVKNYKQLQIHCLKFWGPTTAVSRPATVSNQTIARKLPVEGEAALEQDGVPKQKLVQGILQVEEAPLSEMDVIAEAVRDTVDKFIESIEEQAIAKDIQTFRSELETVLIEQVDLLDDHSLLRASVKKASAVKKELRVRLLETQRERQRTRVKLQRVRSDFEREERARRRLEETHKFLTDLETLREEVDGSDNEQEDRRLSDGQKDHAKTGLRSLIATVGSRCRGGSASIDTVDAPPGMLGTLVNFNRTLEAMEKTVREMPRISKSQEMTPSNWSNDLGVSDDSDY
ncbi:hypothetical protein BGZ70_009648 [Mortierella alpina]|uniref:Inner kinetochore subunit AME1 domain-containing protein n=1 Tax=Mortierella alpina TaxID=64518 RepID=A0A9P6M6Q8_MORAP|nr:hypothetical protein BGZ70_009648 [Mortierella alpina]